MQHYLLTFGLFCDRILMSRGQGATETQSTKVEQKSLKKTLDKYPYLWYNTSTRGEENKVACE